MRLVATDRQSLLPRDHGLFGQCHASTLARLPDGELLAAFFAGRREGEGDVAIWLARTRRGQWLPPRRLMAEDGLAHWNPVLHAEGGRVWLFWKVGSTVHDWVTRWSVSADGGASWESPAPLVRGETLPRGPVRNKLIMLSNGEWLAGGSIETDRFWDAFADVSADHGTTWTRYDVPIDHAWKPSAGAPDVWKGLAANALWETDVARVFRWDGVIQPTLWESAPGRVHMLLRSTRGFVYRSDSADAGRSWCPAYATSLPNNNSGIDVARMHDGALVLVSNPVAGNWGRRYPISVSASTDDGATWERVVDLETDEGEFSYPAIIADGDVLHVAYTSNRTNIVYRRLERSAR
jgi:predicted neuraminidase